MTLRADRQEVEVRRDGGRPRRRRVVEWRIGRAHVNHELSPWNMDLRRRQEANYVRKRMPGRRQLLQANYQSFVESRPREK